MSAFVEGKVIAVVEETAGSELAAPVYGDVVLADSPALYWTLDGATGATDLSGHGRNGTGASGITIGGATGLDAEAGGATDFAGASATDDHITSSYNPFVGGTSRTFEGWAWRDVNTGYRALFGNSVGDNDLLRLNVGGNDVQFRIGGGSTTWAGAWPGLSQWVYWVLVFNDVANTAELFLNGASVSSASQANTWSGGSPLLAVGTGWFSDPGYNNKWDGKQAHFAVYESALSAARIAAHYAASSGTTPAGASTITVVDGQDFDDIPLDSAGALNIDGHNYYFQPTSEEATTLGIVPVLADALPEGTPVVPHPLGAVERFAHVMTPDAEEELVCRVPHSLYERLAVGIRGEETGAPALPTYAELVEADGAALYWPLDSVGGATDQIGSADGAAVGGVTIGGDASEPAGFSTGSTDFDGSNDFIENTVYDPMVNGTTRTFEGWAWRDDQSNYHTLFTPDAGTNTHLFLYASLNDAYFNVNGTGVSWAGAWAGTAQWVYYALVFNEATNTAELFINGVSKGTRTQAAAWPAQVQYFNVGYSGYGAPWNGKQAHFAVYDFGLTADQILAHYETGADLLVAEETLPPDQPENVIATLDDDEWVITDVLDKSPDISGAYVDSGQDSVPHGIGTTPVTASYTETSATVTVTPEADGKLMVFWGSGVEFTPDVSTLLTVSVTLSLLVDGVQTGQERTAAFTEADFGTGGSVVMPMGGQTSVDVEGGVEVELTIGVMGVETKGSAVVLDGKSGGLSYVAFGG